MLRKGDTITVNVAVENETELRVTVFPKLFTRDGERGADHASRAIPKKEIGRSGARLRLARA